MKKCLKWVAVAAMVAVVAAVTPVVGFAAGNAQIKASCMEMANAIAAAMAQTNGTRSKEVLSVFAAGMKKNGGTVTCTDTELLWVLPVTGNPSTQIKIYPALREVRVESKSEELKIYETASAKY